MTRRQEDSGLSLISATPALADVLAALHEACFSEAWDAAAIVGLLEMPGVFGVVALVPGPDAKTAGTPAPSGATTGPAGFILCRIAADECEVLTIAVLPDCRRQGVATVLIEKACETAAGQGAHQMFLEVSEINTAAAGLYRKCGFTGVGRRSGYYSRPGGGREAALIMVRAMVENDS